MSHVHLVLRSAPGLVHTKVNAQCPAQLHAIDFLATNDAASTSPAIIDAHLFAEKFVLRDIVKSVAIRKMLA